VLEDAELEGIHAELLLDAQPLGEGVAHEARGLRRLARELEVATDEGVVGQELEVAELVLRPDSDATLRASLVLHDLDEGLVADPGTGLLGAERLAPRSDRLEHQAAREIRVVRNRDVRAAGDAQRAAGLQRAPQAPRRRSVDRGRRELGHVLVAEQHVAVEIARVHRGRPLVGDEGRERAAGAAVVGGLRRVADVAPRPARRVDAVLAGRAAEAVPLRLRQPRQASVHHEERETRPAAIDAADDGVVAGERGVVADVRLAEELGVVRDGSEVERSLELGVSPRRSVVGMGLQPDALAPREAVRVARQDARALGARIERVRGVHVQVAEEGPAKRIAIAAGLAQLRALERGAALRHGRARAEGDPSPREQRGGDAARPQSKIPSRFAVGPLLEWGVR
jgi:hypothetical protein